MDRHIWTDKKGLIRVINRAVIAGYADETQATQEEVLRLAQREADLERRVCDLKVRELDLGTEVTRLNRRITEQVHQLADSESRGRQYALELAEKAERIRELEGQLSVAEELAADRLAYIADFEPQAIATGAENERLRTAIADGIAHIEKARQRSLEVGYAVLYPDLVEQIDLAHEVLSKPSQPLPRVPATGAPLPSATAPSGWRRRRPPTCEIWQRVHASMLADHADRLKKLESLVARALENGHKRRLEIDAMASRLASQGDRLLAAERTVKRHDETLAAIWKTLGEWADGTKARNILAQLAKEPVE